MRGGIQIAYTGARFGFAGPRVMEKTIREKLPEGFQRSEFLLEHGMVDMVGHRHELRDTLSRLARILTKSPAVVSAGSKLTLLSDATEKETVKSEQPASKEEGGEKELLAAEMTDAREADATSPRSSKPVKAAKTELPTSPTGARPEPA